MSFFQAGMKMGIALKSCKIKIEVWIVTAIVDNIIILQRFRIIANIQGTINVLTCLSCMYV